MDTYDFSQVDVFAATPLTGNPVAVVHDARGLDDEQMAAFASWTNLSETTFLLPPTAAGADAGADYRLRIFTPAAELPFAGHPTLGSAHAWLESGGTPRTPGELVQECGAGLVTVPPLFARVVPKPNVLGVVPPEPRLRVGIPPVPLVVGRVELPI